MIYNCSVSQRICPLRYVRLCEANDRYRWEAKVTIQGIVPLNGTYLDANPTHTIAARRITEKQIRLLRGRLISVARETYGSHQN